MNLLQRLKPKVLEAMNEDSKRYPTLIKLLKKALEQEEGNPLNLSVENGYSICQYNKTELGISTLLDCFFPQ